MLQPDSEPLPGVRLRQRLGKGGFGDVWSAVAADGTAVALKFIDYRNHSAGLLRNEVRVLRALGEASHPHLIRLRQVTTWSHYLVLCMELADGNLHELRQAYLAETGRHVPPEHLLEMLEQAAAGLDYLAGLKLAGFNLTSAGLQHCDVKPSNLLLVGEVVKVADFGLCAPLGERTHRGGWRGTLPYAAPELYRGRASDRTDQYALAVTFCDLLSGPRMLRRDPVCGGVVAPVDLVRARRREAPVLARALDPDPTRRWPSCRAFVAALREVVRLPRDLPAQRRLSVAPSAFAP